MGLFDIFKDIFNIIPDLVGDVIPGRQGSGGLEAATDIAKLGSKVLPKTPVSAAAKAEKLETQRRRELESEARVRDVEQQRAATRGRRFGVNRQAFLGRLGFGSGDTSTGAGSGSLFGN